MSTERNPRLDPSQGGFAFAMVVFLLFAIAVAGATGYQAVRTEFFQSQQSSETGQALAVAEAGLAWFVGGQRGVVADTTEYSLNGGTAVITTRKVAEVSDGEDLYLVTSEGTYTDPRYPQVPAVRVVSQYTTYRKIPMNTVAPLMTTHNGVDVDNDGEVTGVDQASFGDCAGAPAATLAGVVAAGNSTNGNGGITGTPWRVNLHSFDNVVDSVGLAWDIYTDPDYPVDMESMPSWFWFLVRPDTFPVIRVDGNFTPSNNTRSGRGLLIITGTLNIPRNPNWQWEGIVIAGDMNNVANRDEFYVDGALVLGQGTDPDAEFELYDGRVRYNSCYVTAAGAGLAHMEPISNSWWEVR